MLDKDEEEFNKNNQFIQVMMLHFLMLVPSDSAAYSEKKKWNIDLILNLEPL